MSKIKNKQNKKSTLVDKVSKQSKLLVIVFVAIAGLLAVTSSYANSKKSDYTLKTPVEQTTISLTKEKPLIISKNPNGKISYESRGKSIDVAVSGTVYCTPENDGPVKMITLTQDQLLSTEKQIEAIQPASDTTKQDDIKSSIGNSKQLQLSSSSNVAPVETNAVNPSKSMVRTEQLLDSICQKANTTIPSQDLPAFIPDTATLPKRKKRSSLFNNVFSSMITPKTYAADTPAPLTTPPPALNTDAENDQLSRINYVRQQNSRPLLSKSECLTKAARTWSLNMATVDRLYHSPLAQTVEKECGANWWAKLGENVGFGGDSMTIFNAYMNSPHHKDNILDPAFQRVGVGAYTYKHPTKPNTFVWTTQLFARCMGSCANK